MQRTPSFFRRTRLRFTEISASPSFSQAPLTITEFIVARENIEVHGRMAINRGSYTLKFTLPAGAGSDDGKFLWVLKKDDDGRWKIAVDMFSSNRPPS